MDLINAEQASALVEDARRSTAGVSLAMLAIKEAAERGHSRTALAEGILEGTDWDVLSELGYTAYSDDDGTDCIEW